MRPRSHIVQKLEQEDQFSKRKKQSASGLALAQCHPSTILVIN